MLSQHTVTSLPRAAFESPVNDDLFSSLGRPSFYTLGDPIPTTTVPNSCTELWLSPQHHLSDGYRVRENISSPPRAKDRLRVLGLQWNIILLMVGLLETPCSISPEGKACGIRHNNPCFSPHPPDLLLCPRCPFGSVSLPAQKGRNCKFSGRDCSFSHGIEVPLLELLLPDENYNSSNRGSGQTTSAVNEAGALSREPCAVPEAGVGASAGSGRMSAAERWLATLDAGSRVLARYHDRVWYDATAEHPAVDGFLAVRFTGFEDEGSVSLPANLSHLAPPDYDDGAGSRGGGGVGASPARDDEESELEDAWANDDGDDDEFFFRERVLGDRREDGSARVGVGKGAEAGSCLLTDAYVFGDWEQHTKGFGSRMLSRMGYRRGEGLGKEKQARGRFPSP